MGHIVTQEDIRLLRQPNRTVYAKFDLLNKNFKTVGRLEGVLMSDSYSCNADSDIRKTLNLSIYVKDSSFVLGRDRKIWLDKYIRVYMGILNLRTQSIVWYSIGVFLFSQLEYSYDAVSRTLSLSCVDRTAELNGERNGRLSGIETKIYAGSDIRSSIVSTVTQLGGIQKYRIDDIGKEVPYDLEFSTGATVWDIIKELRDLYVGWETFFDEDTFICQAYPTTTDAPIALDDSVMREIVISESYTPQINAVYNVIELWGKCNEPDYYTTDVTYADKLFTCTYGTVDELAANTIFGFKAVADNVGEDSFKVDSYTAYPIYQEGDLPIEAGRIVEGKSYMLKYIVNGSSSFFMFYGEAQVGAIAKLVSVEPSDDEKALEAASEPTVNIVYIVDPLSPFCIDKLGERRDVRSGGEYDNIYSDDLAMQRAKYDLWLATDMLDTINLNMIEIPWLEVNQKISYTSLTTGETDTYIIKQKQGSAASGTMTLTCVKFKPTYSWA